AVGGSEVWGGGPQAPTIAPNSRLICAATRNAFAVIVRLGFTPPDVGMKLPSTTNRFGNAHTRHSGDRMPPSGVRENRAVPTACEKLSMSRTFPTRPPARRR